MPRSTRMEVNVDGRTLELSNLDKVMYPATGFTKGEVIDYYTRVCDAMLPHLRERPLTLKRYPNGVDSQFFYEKNCPAHRPDWVRTEAVWSRHNGANIDFCVVDDRPTLVWLAQLACLEMHTSMAYALDPPHPNIMVFDLDPGPGTNIIDCARVGCWLRDIFDHFDLQSFPKTSGSKGMQLYVPLHTGGVEYTNGGTKDFSRACAELLQKQHPDEVVSSMAKELRRDKVFVDWSQNDEHKTTVCVYSLRAKERPTVSTPLTWDEVEQGLESGDPDTLSFTAGDVIDRIAEHGDLFAPVATLEQELPKLRAS
jgi:bifunctional non-homologous end joining protein LigD